MTDAAAIAASTPRTSPRKIGAVVALALATAVPGLLVSQLVGEREDRAAGVRDDIARAWGPAQQVSGPVLVLKGTEGNGAARVLALAPRSLRIQASVAPTTRRRGLFAATVYEATLTMTGSFEPPTGFGDGGPDHLTPDATLLALSLSGTQGVRDDDGAEVGGVRRPWQACADAAGSQCQANVLVTNADLDKAQNNVLPFSLTLHLRGTGALRVATAAKSATTRIQGAWPTPSYVGTDLPNAAASSAGGFTAEWTQDKVGHPRYVKVSGITGIDGASTVVGVDLIEAVPVYRAVNRATKYGLLVVALAFAAYVLMEVATGVRVSLFQYAMLGASLSLFTLLLLSVSEVAGYGAGYAASTLLVVGQASLYTWSVTRRAGPAAVLAAVLAIVFGFLHLLLGLETYSLLVGAVALFVVVSVVMGVTQGVAGAGSLRAPT